MVLAFLKDSIFYLCFHVFLIGIITTDKYMTKKNKRLFILAAFISFLLVVFDYIEFQIKPGQGNILLREIASYSGYSLRPFLILCFMHLCAPNRKHYIFCGFSIINLILYFTSHYTHWCVYFTPSFNRGPLSLVVFILCFAGLLIITIHSMTEYYHQQIRRWLIPPVCSVLIIYAVHLDYIGINVGYPSNLNKIILIVMFQFYLFYHLALVDKYEHRTIQEQQLQLMVSQIKPHFFFNTITTIQALCIENPSKASETLGLFASYVRQNINSQTDNLIPFNEEIKHVKTYVSIEKLRFPNIEVLYNLQFTDFDIATLSIQPLVENAIKYGVRSREHGIVSISTQKDNNAITITISDNGIGFDTETLNKLDDTHIGIRNVKQRLAILQKAKMDIVSNPEGTTITITIPWEEN